MNDFINFAGETTSVVFVLIGIVILAAVVLGGCSTIEWILFYLVKGA